MDIPRLALIAASILLGLMLLGEWTRFSAEQQNAGSAAIPMVDEFAGLDAPSAPDTVAANTMAATTPNTDLPINEDVELPTLDSVATAAASSYRGNVITVETDVLQVIIDLEGGDVVGAALKAYPKTLDDPSDPF
ncbi:MAG: YidC/Oxa1 family insertase periplasmic-domain containing protein, partial [Luminiphilus sp.]